MRLDVVHARLVDAEGREAPFMLTFFGIPMHRFMVSPGGGALIRRALERMGLEGQYVSSPLLVSQPEPVYFQPQKEEANDVA